MTKQVRGKLRNNKLRVQRLCENEDFVDSFIANYLYVSAFRLGELLGITTIKVEAVAAYLGLKLPRYVKYPVIQQNFGLLSPDMIVRELKYNDGLLIKFTDANGTRITRHFSSVKAQRVTYNDEEASPEPETTDQGFYERDEDIDVSHEEVQHSD